jgi:hypothetical protein
VPPMKLSSFGGASATTALLGDTRAGDGGIVSSTRGGSAIRVTGASLRSTRVGSRGAAGAGAGDRFAGTVTPACRRAVSMSPPAAASLLRRSAVEKGGRPAAKKRSRSSSTRADSDERCICHSWTRTCFCTSARLL